ncbi:MAG: 50S ribosomal protein L21 [Myxococcota bacterium]
MYAVIRTGGKQHRVVKGERLKVDRLGGDVGSEITLEDILLVGGEGDAKIGTPVVDGAKVTAKILRQDRGSKVRVFKKRRRKGSKKLIGHRQAFTELEITGIEG